MGQRARDLLQCRPAWREKDSAESVCGDVSEYVCVCVGGCWWRMTSPLRETFPQPAHKEGRQKVKRMRKNRNLTQCVKKEAEEQRVHWRGGGHLSLFSSAEIFRLDRSSAAACKDRLRVSARSRSLRPPAESPAAILSNGFDFSLHFLVHFLSRRLTSTWPLLSPLLDDITFLALLARSAV